VWEFPPVRARWVGLHVKSSWHDAPAPHPSYAYDTYVGMSKIQFFMPPPLNVEVTGSPEAYGVADPAYGRHWDFEPGATFTASVSPAWTNAAGTTFALAEGWETLEDDGHGVFTNAASGLGASFTFINPALSSRIVWKFAVTNWLEASAGPGGGVSSVGAWCGREAAWRVVATPDPGHVFHMWTGGVPGHLAHNATLDLPGDQPRVVRALFAPQVSGNVQYVATNGDDAKDGLTPATARESLALAVATLHALGSGTAFLAPGQYDVVRQTPVYNAAGNNIDFWTAIPLTNAVEVRGTTGDPADVTVARHSGDTHVFYLNHPGARLDSLTIRNGMTQNYGGNLHIGALGGTVSNCVSTACAASGNHNNGGGVHMLGGLVTHSAIVDNTTYGGYEARYGAGVYMNGGRLEHSLVARNRTTGSGTYAGGIRMDAGFVVNCTVADNTSYAHGGVYAVNASRVINTVIAGNHSPGLGGSAAAWGGHAACFTNCFTDTVAPINAFNFNANASVLLSNISMRDYNPAPNSPILNASADVSDILAGYVQPAVDLAGNDRDQGGGIDAGCFEVEPGRFIVNYVTDVPGILTPVQVVFTINVEGANPANMVYNWDYGDGNSDSGTARNVFTNVYEIAGTYTATLTATDTATGRTRVVLRPELKFAPSVLYVDPANTAPGASREPYHTPANAATSIQTTVDYAVDGCEIVLLKGDYPVTSGILVEKALRIRGETGNPEDVVIHRTSGDFSMMQLNQADAWLDSVVLQNAYRNGAGASLYIGTLGGSASNLVIRNAGGVYHHSGTAVNMNNVNALVTHSVITNNFVNCNPGWQLVELGVIHINNGRLENCLVAGNYYTGAHSNRTSVIHMQNGVVRNCTLAGNQTSMRGVVHIPASWDTRFYGHLTNCVVAGNAPPVAGVDPTPLVTGGAGVESTFFVCTTDGGVALNATCNFGEADAIFKNFAAGDYRLRQGSPAVNAGPRVGPEAVATAGVDLDGNPRIFGNRMDNGCYELQHAGGTLLLVR